MSRVSNMPNGPAFIKDAASEQALLQTLLMCPELAGDVFTQITPARFGLPRHQEIAEVIRDLNAEGRPGDVTVVRDELSRRGALDRVGGPVYLLDLLGGFAVPASLPAYVEAVERAWARNQLGLVGVRLMQRSEADTVDVLEESAFAMATLEDLATPGSRSTPPPTDVLEFVVEPSPPRRWVVPGLLAQGDRLLLTATEGGGKSTLLRMLAVCAAAGLHPFSGRPCEPRRALIVDCENDREDMKDWLRSLLGVAAKSNHAVAAGMLGVEVRSEGLDLVGSARDVGWLVEKAALFRPELLVLGPIYKLHQGDPNDEELARKLAGVIDLLRARHQCAVLIEAHAPHKESGRRVRDMRPAGSSLFKRWPSFGIGLVAAQGDRGVFNVEHWRGARTVRQFPQQLRWGGPGAWPWVDVAIEGW